MRRWRPAALLAVGLALGAAPARACFVDWVTVEANEGGASGGHAAIRFGEETFHFQHHHPGVLRLRRDDWSRFLFAYGVLQNRGLHVSRIAASDATCALLRDHFSARYVIQAKQFDVLDDLAAERALLETLLARHDGRTDATVRLRGAGFFLPDPGPAAEGAAPAAPLVALRAEVARRHGPGYVRARAAALASDLARLRPDPGAPDVALDGERYPVLPAGFARRYRDAATGLVALHVLEAARPLEPGTFDAPEDDDFVLTESERRALGAAAARLATALTDLVASPRPDFGFALLVGMARLVALEESARRGRLAFVDAFSPEAEVIDHASLARRHDLLAELLVEARADLGAARTELAAAGAMDETRLALLEAAANRLRAVRRAALDGADLPVQAGPLLPSREAAWDALPEPPLARADLVASLARARAREAAYAARLRRLYGYRLVGRNCVSELFRTVNDALAQDAGGAQRVRAESTARLGGYVGPPSLASTIPFVATRTVRARFAVAAREDIPSYRRARVAALAARGAPALVALRESNVLTSTVYARNPEDSVFLFFTDGAAWPRPVLGAINLVTALGAGVAGVVTAAADGGALFAAGVRGAVFSLPELAFVSLRKGSFDYVAPEGRAAYARRLSR